MQVESDRIGGVGGGEDGKKGDYSPFRGTEGDFVVASLFVRCE